MRTPAAAPKAEEFLASPAPVPLREQALVAHSHPLPRCAGHNSTSVKHILLKPVKTGSQPEGPTFSPRSWEIFKSWSSTRADPYLVVSHSISQKLQEEEMQLHNRRPSSGTARQAQRMEKQPPSSSPQWKGPPSQAAFPPWYWLPAPSSILQRRHMFLDDPTPKVQEELAWTWWELASQAHGTACTSQSRCFLTSNSN